MDEDGADVEGGVVDLGVATEEEGKAVGDAVDVVQDLEAAEEELIVEVDLARYRSNDGVSGTPAIA